MHVSFGDPVSTGLAEWLDRVRGALRAIAAEAFDGSLLMFLALVCGGWLIGYLTAIELSHLITSPRLAYFARFALPVLGVIVMLPIAFMLFLS